MTIFSTITDGEDTVIKFGTTVSGDNTRLVLLKYAVISFDSNGNRLFVESSSQLSCSWADIFVR